MSAAVSGYRPQHAVHDNYQTSAAHEYIDVEEVSPGSSARDKVWFAAPEVYPGTLWPGRTIELFEGSRQVGTLTVGKVLNAILMGSAADYSPIRKPSSSQLNALRGRSDA